MFEPKKIYEGYHTILRNIVPGIIILSPLILLGVIDLENINFLKLFFVYLLFTLIAHSLYELLGYTLLSIGCKKVCENDKKCVLWPMFLFPSYFVYRVNLQKELCKIHPVIVFERYREFLDTDKGCVNFLV